MGVSDAMESNIFICKNLTGHSRVKGVYKMTTGNKWKDHYTDRAREENWLARSVYKLEEIDKKYRLIKQGSRILDLGCYPGSWTQFCIKRAGQGGKVIGIDIQRPDRVSSPNFRFIEADILAFNPEAMFRTQGKSIWL